MQRAALYRTLSRDFTTGRVIKIPRTEVASFGSRLRPLELSACEFRHALLRAVCNGHIPQAVRSPITFSATPHNGISDPIY